MPIVPDTKDWTWVLDRPCPECGFDSRTFPREQVPDLIRANAADWHELLTSAPGGLLATRPADDRWSAVEYACHVRDVFDLYDYRLSLMLDEDDPDFPNWDQDDTAVEQDYGSQDPVVVLEELEASARKLARNFATVEGDSWERTGNRSDGAHFTVETFARYLVHDPIHHADDVRKGLAELGG